PDRLRRRAERQACSDGGRRHLHRQLHAAVQFGIGLPGVGRLRSAVISLALLTAAQKRRSRPWAGFVASGRNPLTQGPAGTGPYGLSCGVPGSSAKIRITTPPPGTSASRYSHPDWLQSCRRRTVTAISGTIVASQSAPTSATAPIVIPAIQLESASSTRPATSATVSAITHTAAPASSRNSWNIQYSRRLAR